MSKLEYLKSRIVELCKLPKEVEWVEFKHNNATPKEIGSYLSALSNSAALNGKPFAYLLWGIEDDSHNVMGTTFKPSSAKVGNEELENWLLKLLEPKIHFQFYEIDMNELSVVLLQIPAASSSPVLFEEQRFIRVGSYKKKLKDHPEKERELWRSFDRISFEKGIAKERASSEEVLRLLDYSRYFDLSRLQRFVRQYDTLESSMLMINEAMKPLSQDIRVRIVNTYQAGNISIRKVAKLIGIQTALCQLL